MGSSEVCLHDRLRTRRYPDRQMRNRCLSRHRGARCGPYLLDQRHDLLLPRQRENRRLPFHRVGPFPARHKDCRRPLFPPLATCLTPSPPKDRRLPTPRAERRLPTDRVESRCLLRLSDGRLPDLQIEDHHRQLRMRSRFLHRRQQDPLNLLRAGGHPLPRHIDDPCRHPRALCRRRRDPPTRQRVWFPQGDRRRGCPQLSPFDRSKY
jgi:hypothetical protein